MRAVADAEIEARLGLDTRHGDVSVAERDCLDRVAFDGLEPCRPHEHIDT